MIPTVPWLVTIGRFPMTKYVLASMAALMLVILPAAGQTAKATWTPPRTPDGQPDIQGVWTNNTVTPLQRPKALGTKEFYTEKELVDIQKGQQDRLVANYAEGEPPANHSGVPGAPA